jgi:hypothetical protein
VWQHESPLYQRILIAIVVAVVVMFVAYVLLLEKP